jgi:hypothetical protein
LSKLAVSIVLMVLITGVGTYLFVGNESVKQKALDGHNKLKVTIRSWDYVAN